MLSCVPFLEWLLSLYEEQWNRMLNVYNGSDQGPIEVAKHVFEKFACRCGRILEKNTRVSWKVSFSITLMLFNVV